jgi:hypothetical protein
MSEYFSKETRVRIARLLCTAVLSLVIVPRASSQKVYFPGASPTDTIALSHAMSRLAGDLLTVYRSGGTRDFGPNRRLALQILANEY